jgi:hypothetical protein
MGMKAEGLAGDVRRTCAPDPAFGGDAEVLEVLLGAGYRSLVPPRAMKCAPIAM